MNQITVTEALAELKLIEKKVQKKEVNILSNMVLVTHHPDPLEKVGGSKKFCAEELQSLRDLLNRQEKIRHQIMMTNAAQTVTINGITKTIHEWLVWKREVYPIRSKQLEQLIGKLKTTQEDHARNPRVYEVGNEKHIVKYQYSLDYSDLLKEQESLVSTYEQLDGVLSLKNATMTITIQ